MSDDSYQDGATTEFRTKNLLKWLRDNIYINTTVSNIWQDIDFHA